MSFQDSVAKLLQKEVNRREFLLMILMLGVATIGAERFLKVVDLPKREIGFGTGPYGGPERKQ
jgi:hypothetical protein